MVRIFASQDDGSVEKEIKTPGAVTIAVSPHSSQEEENEPENANELKRTLSTRQISMISVGGTIGTGLFLGLGKSLAQSGPASVLITYAIIGAIVFLVMLALGEMNAYIPTAGSFCSFASRFIDPSVGFAMTWNYWANDAISVASDLTALQLVFKYWTNFHSWIIALIFWAFILAINIVSVSAYGEIEYWLSLLKVISIVILVILGIVVNCGANTDHQYLGFHYWYIEGAPFVHGFRGFAKVFVTAAFAYGGTESIGITAGESKNPHKTMPRVVRTVFWRILLFYLLSVLIVGIDVPWNWPNLSNGDTITSPFTIVFERAGSQAAGSFINAVIVTSVISASNHALYAGTRLMYTLAKEGYAPKFVGTLTPTKVPWVALLITWLVAGLCFGSSFIGTGTLWTWLQSLVGVSNLISWLIIGITSLRFRKGLEIQGKTHELVYQNWTYPWGPWIIVIVVTFIILVQGWSTFSPWDTASFFQSYIELGIMPVMIVGWKILKRTSFVKTPDMDFESGLYIETEEDLREREYEENLRGWRRAIYQMRSFFL